MIWLTKLKIAIVEKDTSAVDTLLDEIPNFEDLKDVKEAMYLLKEALELLYSLRDETAVSMAQIKKNIEFLQSTRPTNKNTLDVSS
jgi:hypothetical protein